MRPRAPERLPPGFEPIEEWPGSYWHPKHRAMVIVYVDDFKMAGPTASTKNGWEIITTL